MSLSRQTLPSKGSGGILPTIIGTLADRMSSALDTVAALDFADRTPEEKMWEAIRSCNLIYLSHSLTAPGDSQLLEIRNVRGLTALLSVLDEPLFLEEPIYLSSIVDSLVLHDADMRAVDMSQRTSLHWAVKVRSYRAVGVMLRAGALDNKVNSSGKLTVIYTVWNGHIYLPRMCSSATA